ncbi:MAG: ATP-binding cassette domain-containing protein [Anaerolineae bacterium]
MSTIRLEDVSRAFSPAEATRLAVAGRGLPGFQVDRAFAERVAVRTREEAAGRGAHGEILALDHVNLLVPDGQTIAVLGPSGCGKSTLLRVVAGLDTGYTGTVYYDGRDVRDIPPGDRYIGMVFQNYALYPHFPGRGNLRFFFQVRKAPDAEAEERIRITSEIMGIGFEELLERKPGTLSGGQQQRLAIGRAIVRNPRLFLFREHPYVAITPHLLRNRTSTANSYVLLSEAGKALVIDFGYDFMAGEAAGYDRAARRPWLYTLPMLKRDFGVTQIEVALPTHYHDDHVAGFNLLRDVEGTQVWAAESFADILERPAAYDLPCLWYDPIPVDRRLPLGEPIPWYEYQITLYPLPGHTLYAVAIAFEVDGLRVLATGDQYQGDDGSELNYVYQNRYRIGDYQTGAELYRQLRPDLIVSGHWEPLRTTPDYFDKLVERDARVEQLHRNLLHPDIAGLDAGGFAAHITPYQATVRGGEPAEFVAEVHCASGDEVTIEVVTPPGWKIADHPRMEHECANDTGRDSRSGMADLRIVSHPVRAFRFTIIPPPTITIRRGRIAVDVTINGRRFGQQAEALVTVV